MERHLDSIAKWADLADEVVVVDSRSTDGTLELIRQNLRHPNLRIIERDRGLYESWNEGVAATTGKWVYISTAGDIIDRAHLLRLMAAGESSQADVVVSPQRFVNEDGSPYLGQGFRNARIHDEMRGQGIVVLPPTATHFFAFQGGRINALLGSCASDLFHGDFLRARPFPMDYGPGGDTVWTLRHSSQMRLCLVPVAESNFCIHPKPPAQGLALDHNLDRMFTEELARATPSHDVDTARAQSRVAGWAVKLRPVQSERRGLWRGTAERPRNRYRYFQLTSRYLWLRAGLALAEFTLRLRLRKLVQQVR